MVNLLYILNPLIVVNLLQLGDVVSLDLGNIPEEVIKEKIYPLIGQLADILGEYKVYTWITMGYHEENTDNEV